jgi:hypothetical protein
MRIKVDIKIKLNFKGWNWKTNQNKIDNNKKNKDQIL